MNTNNKNSYQKLSEDEIQALILRVQDGETQAFDVIYKTFIDSVYQFVWFKVGHDQTAEDLTSTVFVKMWQALDRYTPKNGAKFSTWLFQIARFTVIDYYRTKKQVDNIEGVAHRLGSDEDIEDAFSREQDAEVVRYVLKELPEKYQNILMLRFVNDLSVAETAEVLKKTEGHVRVLQHRGLKKMKAYMKENGLEEVFESI